MNAASAVIYLIDKMLSWIADICSALGIEQDRGMLMIRVATSEKLTDSLLRLVQGINSEDSRPAGTVAGGIGPQARMRSTSMPTRRIAAQGV